MLDHQKQAAKTNEKEVPSSQPIDSIRLPQIPLRQNLTHQAIQQGQPARYPYKKKKYFPTKWVKDGFKVYENGKIELSMGIHHGKREKPIVVYVSHLPKEKKSNRTMVLSIHAKIRRPISVQSRRFPINEQAGA
ncbi:hypothetical protein [Parageobacillus toebii]|uniref:hypothetical protein n=1 Tax=Parageobacillus toebii TaxID=153151 RepID=UPI002E230DDD|nr:hypothetical protein [Parageobacillus toebii]